VDLKQLTALVTIGDVGSVTKAARVLQLVQPAVSRQIRSLEAEVGVPLFERTRQGMTLTPAGALLAERARRALLELERARAEVRADVGQVHGIVTVGLLESTVEVLACPLVEAVARCYPDVDLRVVSAYSGHLQQWLDDGDVDLTLLYNLASTPSTAVTALLHEPLWAVAPPGEVGRGPLTWKRLARHPLVLPGAGHGLRVLVDEAFSSAGVGDVSVVCQTNSILLQRRLVAGGRGWTVLPASGVAEDIAHGRLQGGPIKGPEVSRTVVLATEAVASEVVKVVRSLVRNGTWPAATVAEREPRA